jgi:outer membrane lipoprotein SlyB
MHDGVWRLLSPEERAALQSRYVVETLSPRSVGTIVDAQSVDESTAGTTGGAQLGGLIGSAAYVDRAFSGRNWNYSATTHLGASLVGALLGSALDKAPQARFHFRYAVRTADGNTQTIDEFKADAFRRTLGECVSLPDLDSLNQSLCHLTVEQVRTTYLANPGYGGITPAAATARARPDPILAPPPGNTGDSVLCKFGSSAPITASQSECLSAEGVVLK